MYTRLALLTRQELEKLEKSDANAKPLADLERQLKLFTDTRIEASAKAVEYLDKIAVVQGKIRILLVDLKRTFQRDKVSHLVQPFLTSRIATHHLKEYATLSKPDCLRQENEISNLFDVWSKSQQDELAELLDAVNGNLPSTRTRTKTAGSLQPAGI